MSCKCDTINIVNDNNIIVVSHADGRDGKSAYKQAVEGGYTGTEQEFNCSLSLLADVAEGKRQIADAINYKGGSASADSSFSKLAEDIEHLPIDGNLTYGMKFNQLNSFVDNIINANNAFENLIEIDDYKGLYKIFTKQFSFPINVKKVRFPELLEMPSPAYLSGNNLKIIDTPKLISSGYFISISDKLEKVILGTLISIREFFSKNQKYLYDITIGEDTNININLSNWTANYVIAEGQSGIDELNSNLYNNLLTKLYDHSQDGQTRTLRLGWLAHVTQENIDYANSKGWTLTT